MGNKQSHKMSYLEKVGSLSKIYTDAWLPYYENHEGSEGDNARAWMQGINRKFAFQKQFRKKLEEADVDIPEFVDEDVQTILDGQCSAIGMWLDKINEIVFEAIRAQSECNGLLGCGYIMGTDRVAMSVGTLRATISALKYLVNKLCKEELSDSKI
jgi:hypothetical protein